MNATTQIHPEALLDHMDFVRGLARSLLFDEHQVDDVVQQTWLQAARRPPRQPGAIRGWLATVVRNLARNTRRDEGRRNRGREPGELEVRVPSTADVVEREATRREVVKAVLALKDPYRTTVLLRYFEGLSPKQIANQLDVPSATVRTRLRRGLEHLRSMLDDAHGGSRQAWCLQLIPLVAYVPDPTITLIPTGAKAWFATAAAALMLVGTGITWAVLSNEDPIHTIERSEGQPVEKGRQLSGEAGPANKRDAASRRREIQDPKADDGTAGAMVGFRGRLLTTDGKPAPGRFVQLAAFEPTRLILEELDPSSADVRAPRIDKARTKTHTDGTFILRGFWPRGHYVLHAGGDSPEFLTRVVSRTPRPGEVMDLGDLRLLAGVKITGKVENADGEPVANALVWSTDLNGAVLKVLMFEQADMDGGLIVHGKGGPRVHLFPAWTRELGGLVGMPSARTDKEGKFSLRGMKAGDHALAVHAASHQPYLRQRLRVSRRGKDVGTIRLREGEEIVGEIVDHEGKPVAGAEVVVAPAGIATRTDLFGAMVPIDFARRPHKTDRRGKFSFTGLPKGRVSVAVRRSPGDPWLVQGPVSPDDDFRCKLPAPISLRVSLKSNAGKKIQPKFKLVQGEVRGEMLLGNLYRPIDVKRRLSVKASGDHVIGDLLPGTYTLVTQADEHVLSVEKLELKSDLLVHVKLQAATPIRVRVTNQLGHPMRGARVYARPDNPPQWSRSILLIGTTIPSWTWLPTYLGKTNRDGRLESSSMAKGQTYVTVSHPAYGSVSRNINLPGAANFTLQNPGRISGRFLSGTRPADPNSWVLGVRRVSGVDKEGPTDMTQLVTAQKDGHFTIHGQAPGEYELEPIPAPDGIHSLNSLKEYVESDHFGFFVTKNVSKTEVFAGRTATVQVNTRRNYAATSEAGAQITGTLFLDRSPAKGFSMMYSDAENFFDTPEDNKDSKAVVDAAGRFDLGRLKVGVYKVAAFDPKGNKIWTQRVEVSAGDDQVLEIALKLGVMQGVVLGPGGSPVQGARVNATLWKGLHRVVDQTTTTNAAGRFVLKEMPEGNYKLHVKASKIGEARLKNIAVVAGEATEDQSVRLQGYVTVSGRIDMSSFGIDGSAAPVIAMDGMGSHHQFKANADGTFSYAYVLPGSYTVSVGGEIRKNAVWTFGLANKVEVGRQGKKDVVLKKRELPKLPAGHPLNKIK